MSLRALDVLAALVLISVATLLIPVMYSLSPLPGIGLELRFYRYVDGRYVEDRWLFSSPNVVVILFVEAVEPSGEDGVTAVFTAAYRGPGLLYIPAGVLEPVAREWLERRRETGGRVGVVAGLVLHILVVDASKRMVLYQVLDSITYRPEDILAGKTLKYKLHIVAVRERFAKIANTHIEEIHGPIPPPLAERVGLAVPGVVERGGSVYCVAVPGVAGSGLEYCYRVRLHVGPRDIGGWMERYCRGCSTVIGGRVYVKTPVLIVDNVHSVSGLVSVSARMPTFSESILVYPVFALSENSVLGLGGGGEQSVAVWRGSGALWGAERVFYGVGSSVVPGGSIWFWVWAQPHYIIYSVEECDAGGCSLIGEEHAALITGIAVDAATSSLIGWVEHGQPPSPVLDSLRAATVLVRPVVPGSLLDDGALSPSESVPLGLILQSVARHECGVKGVGVPVGALASAIVCEELGLQQAEPGCKALQELTGALAAVVDEPLPFATGLDGGIVNHGYWSSLRYGYNVDEYVYIALSRYRLVHMECHLYQCTMCTYSIPLGIYIELR